MLPPIHTPSSDSSIPASRMIDSANRLKKVEDKIHPWRTPFLWQKYKCLRILFEPWPFVRYRGYVKEL